MTGRDKRANPSDDDDDNNNKELPTNTKKPKMCKSVEKNIPTLSPSVEGNISAPLLQDSVSKEKFRAVVKPRTDSRAHLDEIIRKGIKKANKSVAEAQRKADEAHRHADEFEKKARTWKGPSLNPAVVESMINTERESARYCDEYVRWEIEHLELKTKYYEARKRGLEEWLIKEGRLERNAI